jgi:2-oxoglutarate dehydrogenase E2 component (dihydrolipoamide succinyltransferase)
MGVSVSEGTISRWAKQVGDKVEADETIVEISTDKVDTEVPSPASGTVVEIIVQEGETVPVTTVIARIDTAGGAPLAPVEPVAPAEEPAAAEAPAPAPEAAAPAAEEAAPVAEEAAPAPPAPAPDPAAAAEEPPPHFGPATTTGGYAAPSDLSADLPPAPPAPAGDGEANGDMRTFMSPVVARMVAEHGLDISQIPGTGRGGRVTKRDVEVFLEGGGAAQAAAAPAPAAPAAPAPEAPPAAPAAAPAAAAPAPAAPPAPAAAPAPAPAAAAPAPAPAPAPAAASVNAGEEIYKFSTIRRAIAKHMMESILTTAQLTTIIEIDMSAVVAHRQALKADFKARHGVNLTYLPFIMKATVDAIGKWPWVNAEIVGDEAIVKRSVNLGMAVAVDDSKGLLVPVIKNAESLSMVGLARALTDVADRARAKTLTVDEMTGASFTITNPGGYGALMGTPILPVGTTAIIDVEAIQKRPVVITDEQGNDAIGIRHMMYLPMTYDHRLVDGAYAAQFLRDLKRNLETWPIDAFTA